MDFFPPVKQIINNMELISLMSQTLPPIQRFQLKRKKPSKRRNVTRNLVEMVKPVLN